MLSNSFFLSITITITITTSTGKWLASYAVVQFLAFQACSICMLISFLFHLSCYSDCTVWFYFQWLHICYHSLVCHQTHSYHQCFPCSVGILSSWFVTLLSFHLCKCYIWCEYPVLPYQVCIGEYVSYLLFTLLTVCSLRYCFVILSILQMCHVFHVTTLPVFVTLTLYDCPLWSTLFLLTITPCIYCPPSSFCVATVDAIGKETESEQHYSLNIVSWHNLRFS